MLKKYWCSSLPCRSRCTARLQGYYVNFLKSVWIKQSIQVSHCTTDCFQDRQKEAMRDQKLISTILVYEKHSDSRRIWVAREEPSGAITTLKDPWKCLVGILCASGKPMQLRDFTNFCPLMETITVVDGWLVGPKGGWSTAASVAGGTQESIVSRLSVCLLLTPDTGQRPICKAHGPHARGCLEAETHVSGKSARCFNHAASGASKPFFTEHPTLSSGTKGHLVFKKSDLCSAHKEL